MDSDYFDQYKQLSASNDLEELAIQQNDQAMDSNTSQILAPTQDDTRYDNKFDALLLLIIATIQISLLCLKTILARLRLQMS